MNDNLDGYMTYFFFFFNVLDTSMIELEIFKYESQGSLSHRFKIAIAQGETLHE